MPDSDWMFPSPQRGEKDIPAKLFRESLEMVRTKAGMPGFGFHDLRDHFIAMTQRDCLGTASLPVSTRLLSTPFPVG